MIKGLGILAVLILAFVVLASVGETKAVEQLAALTVLMLIFAVPVFACSGFSISDGENVLVGNNEDSLDPDTKVWFVPAYEKGELGRVYFGYANMFPQGGMNENGLFFDGFAVQPLEELGSEGKEVFYGNLFDYVMETCSTVEEVMAVFGKYHVEILKYGMPMFADATGDSVIIDGGEFVRKQGGYQVVTSLFRQAHVEPGNESSCLRYEIACKMLEENPDVSVENCRKILAAIHFEGITETIYSNICDLKNGLVYLYHFHNFENEVVINLREELEKGEHIYDLPDLFPQTFAAEEFREKKEREVEEKKASLMVEADPESYDAYVGRYEIAHPFLPGLEVAISKEEDRLYASDSLKGKKRELLPKSEHVFFYCGFLGETIYTFKEIRSGKTQEMMLDEHLGKRVDLQ
jgi:hypothetical protein